MTREDEDIRLLLTNAVPPLTPPPDRIVKVARRVRRHRQRLIGGTALAVAVVVGLGVGGAQILNHAPSPHTAADPAGQGRWTSCVEAAPEMVTRGFRVPTSEAAALPRLGDDFIPTAVVVCEVESPPVRSEWLLTERRSDDATALAALVAALRLPDAPENPGFACRAILQEAPWLALVDADGRWMRPGIPLASCHDNLPDKFRAALGALPLTTVATRPVAESDSARAGCSQREVDMTSLAADPEARSVALPEPFPAGQQVRLCVYYVPKSRQGNGEPLGEFAHGTVLPEDRRAAIEGALRASRPANPCSTRASRFAVLIPLPTSEPRTFVELDGCRRITVRVAPDQRTIGQGDGALIELIDNP
ncbi:hypothetical protein [Micromonospora saelicesensis]|uniref:hypothetical protein n=1 Tax=Micromonospora saelicesensis TaxID=285676 RepID=UPI000DBF9782|nr:hypothetical protein [Micromonospora saelicesensis]RAO44470.1 hypothetical protein PSN01_05602 [Micromonospora saelicesensis]RAO54205.1 hypothetical protein LUPAC06_04826 [Micromonospora saelicesensis]